MTAAPLLALLALAAPTRAYDGAEAVVADAPAPEPAPASVPASAPEPAPLRSPPAPRVPQAPPEEVGLASTPRPGGPTPRWWGPYPRPKVIGYLGPTLQLTRLHAAFGATVGLGAGAWIRERVAVGAAVHWLLNPIDAGKTALGATQRLAVNYGGLTLAVVVARTGALSFALGGLIGGGGACLQNPDNGNCYARTEMFVGQPGVALHLRLAPVLRLVLGFGYRLVKARAWTGPGELALGGPTGAVMLEFGWF